MFSRKLWTYGLGTVVIVLGIIIAVLWPALSLKLVHDELRIEPRSENYENWVHPPLDLFLSFSLFNWENPDQVRDFNVKPKFREMGPYVFRENRLKADIDFHDNNTVSFYQKRTWYFDKSKSKGNLDDMVTTAHVPSAVSIFCYSR